MKILSLMSTKLNLFNFCSLINEVDLYKEWIPFCKKGKVFKDISLLSKAAIVNFNIGKFLFSREMCVLANAFDRLLHHDSLIVECKSIHEVGLV